MDILREDTLYWDTLYSVEECCGIVKNEWITRFNNE